MLREVPLTVVRGFFMGAADLVPGVSGGTIALVLGIYRRLVAAIQRGSAALGGFARLDVRAGWARLGEVEWTFLLPLLGGIGLAVLVLSRLIESQLRSHPVEMAALFLGLVLGSIALAWRLLLRRDPARILILLAVAAGMFLLLGLRPGTSPDRVGQLAHPAGWTFFLAGAVAICAMVLPGISGSFLRVILGMYGPVLGAVADRDALTLGVFLLGAVVGLALFSQLLHWALETHYDSVMAALIGLMVGSMRVLWPWPGGVDSTALGRPEGALLPVVGAALVGALAVVGISLVADRVGTTSPRAGLAGLPRR